MIESLQKCCIIMSMNINCSKCNAFLGEINKGKLHKKASVLCEKCMEFYKTCESLANYNKGTNNMGGMGGGMDFINDLMKGMKK